MRWRDDTGRPGLGDDVPGSQRPLSSLNWSTFVKIENQLDPRLKTLQNMDADALAALGGLINAIKEAKADGCEPGTVFAWVEEDLRARMAVPVEKSLDRADNDERQAANNRNGDERASR